MRAVEIVIGNKQRAFSLQKKIFKSGKAGFHAHGNFKDEEGNLYQLQCFLTKYRDANEENISEKI